MKYLAFLFAFSFSAIAQTYIKGNNLFVYPSGQVAIGTKSPQAALDVAGTGTLSSIILPRDTTANRPVTAINGMIRYNTNAARFEGYSNGAWTAIGSGSGSVTSVTGTIGLNGGTITTTGSLSVDVGTAANKIVQLTVGAQLPSVDGYLVSNTNAYNIRGTNISATSPTANQVLTYNSTISQWQALGPATSGTVSSIVKRIGLVSGTITTTGTIDVDVGTSANKIVQLTTGSQYPAVDGFLITNLNVPAGGANTTLSNLGTTSLNAKITFQNGLGLFPTIGVAEKASGNSDDFYLNAGGAALGAGGNLNLNGGYTLGLSQDGGGVFVTGSDGAADDGNGGPVSMTAGAGYGVGGGGTAQLMGGPSNGTGTSGSASVSSGDGTGGAGANSGGATLKSGNAGTNKSSGAVNVGSGAKNGSGTAGSLHLYVNDGGSGTNEVRLSGNNMHIETASGLPVVSACGTSPTNVGNDNVGIVTVGTGGVAASCTITFSSTWTNAPSCVVIDDTTALLLKASASTTVLTVTQGVAFGASDKLSYHCFGYL